MFLKSLTEKARKVFKLLANPIVVQIDKNRKNGKKRQEDGDENDEGIREKDDQDKKMTFNTLFEKCRQKFYVSNPTDLQAILTELRTHELLEERVGADAAKQLWLPLSPAQAKLVLDELNIED